MPTFEPRDDKFEERVRASFVKQRVMETIGARLVSVIPGRVEIELEYREDLTQQDGYIHGAITTSIVDSACGYAAHSLMPPDSDVLTVEYKVNFLAPARAQMLNQLHVLLAHADDHGAVRRSCFSIL